jgi:CBS domain-containing protein
VFTCRETDRLGEAARQMWEHDVGFLPVVREDGTLAGVITDRDGFIAAYFEGRPLWEIEVKNAMSTRVATVGPDDAVDEAEERMIEFQVHRLPVVDGGKVVGVVSINDLARRAASDADETSEEAVALTLGSICTPRTGALIESRP